MEFFDPEMTDSSSQSDTSGGSGSRGRALNASLRRRKGTLNAKERNIRRLESNERERMRMHSLNDAFQVNRFLISMLNDFIVNVFPLMFAVITRGNTPCQKRTPPIEN